MRAKPLGRVNEWRVLEPIKRTRPVSAPEADRLAIVATLSNMVRNATNDDAGDARHRSNVADRKGRVKPIGDCPALAAFA